jgi:hypothetical protein
LLSDSSGRAFATFDGDVERDVELSHSCRSMALDNGTPYSADRRGRSTPSRAHEIADERGARRHRR